MGFAQSEFEFITFQNADEFKSRSKRRAVRSHIVRRTFERKRGNFRNTSTEQLANERQTPQRRFPSVVLPPNLLPTIDIEMLDPFISLPVDQAELQNLLRDRAYLLYLKMGSSDRIVAIAQQAVEPVFSISDPYSFHDLHEAYTNAFADAAFSNALMCAICLAKDGYVFTPKVLHYQGLAIKHINRHLQSPSSYECTVGAILLLVGVEWRTGYADNAQIHLRGINKLLRVCESERRTLSPSVRRGIFWQDVNTAIVSARDRVMERATFPEFLWDRETFKVDWARLPTGFEDLRGELGDVTANPFRDIYVLLQDIFVLQKHAEALACCKPDISLITDMDNMQACIEARLLEQLQEGEDNQLRMAVLLTAYLYAYSLFTEVWHGSTIPLHIASRLLALLQETTGNSDYLREPQRSVVLWCTFVAGCLTPEGPARISYELLFQSSFGDLVVASSINASWFAISGILDRFLWSQVIFGDRALGFLKENVVLVSKPSKTTSGLADGVQKMSSRLSIRSVP